MNGRRVLRLVRPWVTAILPLLAAATAQAQTPPRDPKLAPEPAFFMKNNGLGFGVPVPTFRTPEEAKGYIEAVHLTWPWTVMSNGTVTNGPLYCPASASLFTKSDFPALGSPSYSSAETPFRAISRQWGQCTQWTGNLCTSFQCVPDSWPFQYNMRADCPVNMVYAASNGQPRCECPAGQELERNAAGEWRCAAPQVASVTNPACYRQDGSCPVGNPASPGTAAKVHTEVDYEGAGAHPLSFTRSFRSHGARPYVEPGAWSHWVHNWGRRIEAYPEPGYRGRAYVVRDDASQRIYSTTGNGTWATAQAGDRNVLTEQRDANGARTGFQYKLWADDSVEHYDPAGRLLRVVQRNGWTNTLTYSDAATPAAIAPRPGLLISARNHFGRELRFTYDAAGRLAELLPPGAVSGTAPGSAASPIRYLHNEASGLGAGVPQLNQLTGVVWQDGAVRRYHYENAQFPQWLTGRTDELGVRIGTYTYNTSGQLVRSEGPAGINAVDFSYAGTTTQVVDRSGPTPTTSIYTWEEAAGVIRPSAVSAPCPQCGTTSARTVYNASGDVARRVDHDGRITFHTYDAKGRETERATFPAAYNAATTRPALNLAERVVSTKWHATWNLPTQVAEPGKVSAYTYGNGGRLTGESWTATTDATGTAKFSAVKTGSTYATGYSYNANVLPSTIIDRVDGVEVVRWASTFDSSGLPTKIVTTEGGTTNTTTLTNSGTHGQLSTVGNSNGAAAHFTFDLRGKLRMAQLPDWIASFDHDARSLLLEVRFTSGAWVRVAYDAAGVPVRVDDSSGGSQAVTAFGASSSARTTRIALRPIEDVLTSALRLARQAQAKPLEHWLPLSEARAQSVPPVIPANALLGLSRIAPGASAGAQPGVAKPGGCCGESGQTIALALEAEVKKLTAPIVLLGMVASEAAQAMVNDFLLLRARDKLRKNMLCNPSTQVPPGCWEAHHIVAWAHPLADRSRNILAAVGIDLNSVLNGVWVECGRHHRMHTSAYYLKVDAILNALPVKDTVTVGSALTLIASQIRAGTF